MLRVGVLYRIGHALDFLTAHPLSEQEFLTSFGNWEGVSGDAVLDTCKRLGWITAKTTDQLVITPVGKSLCDTRKATSRLRLQLEHIISVTRPAWAALAVRGRNAVASYAPSEAVQCLSDAGLLEETDGETVEWWDRLAGYYRTVRDDDKMVTGRLGERCTFEHELRRTAVQPNWVALDTNDAGYDLISRLERDDARRLLIEVKASTLNWEDAEAILTRHEWDVLSRSQHACLDLWCVSAHPRDFLRVSLETLKGYVPEDRGDARWLTLGLPFRVFGSPNPLQ